MKYKLKFGQHSIKINGSRKRFKKGDIIPEVAKRHLERWPTKFEPIEEKSPEEILQKMHTGKGWYKIPDRDKKVRESTALKYIEKNIL